MRNQGGHHRSARGALLIFLSVALGALIHLGLWAAEPGSGVAGPLASSPEPQAAQSTEASRIQQGFPPTNPEMSKEEKLQEIKHDADALAELVTSLKSDLGKADANALEKKELAKRADKIEKLARKIKDSIKRY